MHGKTEKQGSKEARSQQTSPLSKDMLTDLYWKTSDLSAWASIPPPENVLRAAPALCRTRGGPKNVHLGPDMHVRWQALGRLTKLLFDFVRGNRVQYSEMRAAVHACRRASLAVANLWPEYWKVTAILIVSPHGEELREMTPQDEEECYENILDLATLP